MLSLPRSLLCDRQTSLRESTLEIMAWMDPLHLGNRDGNWKLSNSPDQGFCREGLGMTLQGRRKPEIFLLDQDDHVT